MRILKSAVIVAAALAAVAGTSVVASAYPTPKNHHSIDCDPGRVSANDGSCTVAFVDKDKNDHPRAGQTVCFTAPGPGSVTPTCSTTNSKGIATTEYSAETSVSCSGKDPDGGSAVIRGKEKGDDEAGAAQTRVTITCPDTGKDAKTTTGSASTHPSTPTNTSTNGRNASVLLSSPSTSAGGLALGVGILAFIVILAVAITGRLRLRGLRR